MKRAKNLLIIVLALALAAALLVACDPATQPVENEYKLKYSGGEGYTGAVPADVKVAAGSKVTLAGALQWEGHDFVAWTADGVEYAAGAEFTMPEKDVTLIAKWEPKSDDPAKYTLSYAGGEVYKGTLPEAKQYAAGETVTLADALSESGYTFLKWTYGTKEYDAKATFTMPAENVTMTAKWSKDEEGETPPTAQELGDKFYTATNWEYMTNDNGASNDGGDIPYSLSDGSIKFHRLNQAVQIGNRDNGTFSFMLKATNDFHFWMNSTGKDNQGSNSYRLSYEYSGLRIEIDGGVAATVTTSTYKKAEWNRFDVVFKTADGKTTIALWINGEKATLAAGNAQNVALDGAGNVVHTRPARFATGDWAVVKVWEANNYVQFKPVSKADEKDVPIVAAVGASITEGAGAGNFYTESYPAQLQKKLGGAYNVVNLGKSGRTVRTDTGKDTDDAQTPVPWLENVQFDGFKALKPDIVIINMGTNDSKTSLKPVSTLETFKAAYEHLVDELLKVNPEMRVIACTVPTAYSDIYDINNDNIQNIIAPAIRQVAEEKELELVDLCEITKNKSLLFGDGVHPGTEGYAMFAEIFEKVVKGEELTKEFLDGINEKYNDPTYEIKDIHGNITVENGEINLTVTGNIKIDEKYHKFFKLDLNTGDDAQMSRNVPFTTDADGNFSVKARLDDLTGTKWYNVRVYYAEFANYLLTLDDVEYTEGTVFKNNERKVTVQTWTSGEKKVFSLQIADLDESDKISTEIQSVAITTTDGVKLTVSGTTTAAKLTFYAGVHPTEEGKWRTTEAVAIEDGAFTHTFDLSKLFDGATITRDYINFRLYYEDGSYVVVPLDKTTIDKVKAQKGNSFTGTDKKFTIQSWPDGGIDTLSIVVSEYDDSYTITATSITFEGQYLVVKGTATGNVQSLVLALHNDSNMQDNIRETATVTEGAYEVKIDLTKITLPANNWLYLWYSVNGGADAKVKYEKNDTKHVYGNREYRFENWEGIAVAYSDYTPPVPEGVKIQLTELAFEGANLKVKGTVTGAMALKFSLYASEDSEKYEANATITDGTFEASIPLPPSATPHNGSWYRLQVAADDEAAANMTWDKAQNADALKALTHNYGNFNYQFAGDNDIAVITGDYSPALPEGETITLTEVKFDGANLIVKGTATGITKAFKIELHANEDSKTYSQEVTPAAEGGAFEATIALPPSADAHKNCWYRLRVKTVEDEAVGYTNLTWDGNASEIKASSITQTHNNGSYSYKFENTGDIAVTYTDYVAPPAEDKTVKVSSMRFEDGKFIVEGKVGANITKIIFHLHNTNNPAFDLPKQATLEGQNFKVEFPLDEIKREDGSDAPKSYLNVRYEINEEGFGTPLNLLPKNNGDYAVNLEYRYNYKKWELKADDNRTYLN